MIALTIASALAAVLALFGTRVAIGVLAERGASQPILQQNAANERVPPHAHKAGTPTMGGLVILAAALTGYLLSHVRAGVVFSDQTLIIILGILVMAGLGLIDDLLKVRSHQNRGVYWKVKGLVSYLMAVGIAAILVTTTDIDTRISESPRGCWRLHSVQGGWRRWDDRSCIRMSFGIERFGWCTSGARSVMSPWAACRRLLISSA